MSTFRMGCIAFGFGTLTMLTGFAIAETGSSGGAGKGSPDGMSQKGGTHQDQGKHQETPEQAGSQGQQGTKGPGSPMERDKGGDKMHDDKDKSHGKK